MEDWKERFKIEYYELHKRFGKLVYMISKYEEGTLEFKPNCPIDLLKAQKTAMYNYLCVLNERAKLEDIKL